LNVEEETGRTKFFKKQRKEVGHDQWDQIGRFFDLWMTVSYEQFFCKLQKKHVFLGRSFPQLWLGINFGDILGEFFTNSSGHPGHDLKVSNEKKFQFCTFCLSRAPKNIKHLTD
jgi:hypothetical protein